MTDPARIGAGHLAEMMHRALERGDSAALQNLARHWQGRTEGDREACRREWIGQCEGRSRTSPRRALARAPD